MSIAFYPGMGLVLFGSESAATKAAMTMGDGSDGAGPALRLDLDDVNGEVVQLRWGNEAAMRQVDASTELMTYVQPDGRAGMVVGWTHVQSLIGTDAKQRPLMKRMLQLQQNPLVAEIPPIEKEDLVGADIDEIPAILRKIKEDWSTPEESLNRMSALTLTRLLRQRLRSRHMKEHDGSLDVLVTGCEVSLWLGEQFTSDLHLAFPELSLECVSANKLLSLLGQSFPIPQLGFRLHSKTHNLQNTIIILISHSGGTFATLNCSNLLKAFSPNLFVVTSEWDTQVARSVRAGVPGKPQSFKLASYVFTNFCGCRPAEACSLTVVATHTLLTQILYHLMYSVRHYDHAIPNLGGSTFIKEEVRELEALGQDSLKTIDALVHGTDEEGRRAREDLLRQGTRWAQHVLESPIAWILGALYILVTVTLGATPLSATVYAVTSVVSDGEIATESPVTYIVGVVDSVIYAFLPWWMTVLIRLVQGRPWLHRVAGRSLVIGDIPWVAQSTEAFVSKLFALSYSIASITVFSGNPCDHLVHRFTHRVVRGGLLAVGRPDGRLNALTAAENTCSLSVNQASSIQNYGVTCESITIGHNPAKLPLTANHIYLPRHRPRFLSEHIIESFLARKAGRRASFTGLMTGASASSLMGKLASARNDDDEDDNGVNDVFDDLLSRETKSSKVIGGAPAEALAMPFRTIEPLRGKFIGAWMGHDDRFRGMSNEMLMDHQHMLQTLYESRHASLQRFVAFLIMFHKMGKTVADFFPNVSFGLLGYDMSRTHSIMRIATTASPVSGAEVRELTLQLARNSACRWATNVMQMMACTWLLTRSDKEAKDPKRIQAMMRLLYSGGREELVQKVESRQLDMQHQVLKPRPALNTAKAANTADGLMSSTAREAYDNGLIA